VKKIRRYELTSEGFALIPYRGGGLTVPLARLSPRPTRRNPIVRHYLDPEVGGQGVAFILKDGSEGVVLWDQALSVNNDPQYVAELQLYKTRMQAFDAFEKASEGRTTRELAKLLGTSTTQVQRIQHRSPRITLDSLVRALAKLGLEVDVKASAA